ncbi:hypothetical protein Bca4012_077983 [Brassica carinata]
MNVLSIDCASNMVHTVSNIPSEQAVFVILGDAGKELTGKHVSELVASYFESNEGVGADHCVPSQTITITKILPPEAPHPIAHLEEDAIPAMSDVILKTRSEESGPSKGFEDYEGDRVRKASESLESDEAKRSKICALLSGGGYAKKVVVTIGQILPIPQFFQFQLVCFSFILAQFSRAVKDEAAFNKFVAEIV